MLEIPITVRLEFGLPLAPETGVPEGSQQPEPLKEKVGKMAERRQNWHPFGVPEDGD